MKFVKTANTEMLPSEIGTRFVRYQLLQSAILCLESHANVPSEVLNVALFTNGANWRVIEGVRGSKGRETASSLHYLGVISIAVIVA